MQVVTYLGFTLLSLVIQFSVIDFIQGRLKLDEKTMTETKGVSQRRQLRDVLKDVTFKPHALYYRAQKLKGNMNNSPAKFISNITLTALLATTDMTTAIFDILYDENITSTEESFTTEPIYTTTEIENFTEITFYERINETTKTDFTVKKTITEDCSCNLQLKVCDINCCCDRDCLETDIGLFPNCAKRNTKEKEADEYCFTQLPFLGPASGLFCIVKVNLPEDRNLVVRKAVPINQHFTWKSNERSQVSYEFSNSMYKYGNPIWAIKNGTIYHIDLPVPTVNSYCTGRKALEFLKDEKYKCNVKIGDLEMFQIMKSLEEVTVISATPLSMNTSVLNCSDLHCVNWTIVVCDDIVCANYCKSFHEPECTESICTNIASKIEYIFNYHDFKIINATIKFHLKNISTELPLLRQEIEVKYIMGNKSVHRIIKLSGNPGYLNGLPIIVSYKKTNYTEGFYNTTMQNRRHWLLSENNQGFCTLPNRSENFIVFGINRRTHCRIIHKVNLENATNQCKSIQNDLDRFSQLNKQIFVSPLGNPQELEDKEWISIEKSLYNGTVYGQFQERSSMLLCFNLVPRYSMIFGYAQIYGNNRLLSVHYASTARNASFNMNDMSSILTIDISFIDVTKPSVFEHKTGRPSVNLHIPDDFFHPFRSESRYLKSNVFTMVLYFITYFLQIK